MAARNDARCVPDRACARTRLNSSRRSFRMRALYAYILWDDEFVPLFDLEEVR
jgi:hypothetical protein